VIKRLALLVLFLWSGRAVAQTPVIRIDDAGPGVGPAILQHAIAGPHGVVAPDSVRYLIARSADLRGTTIVLGRDVLVEGRVNGDLIVVAGDVYMHPGGSIRGRVAALGGGVYRSALAKISGPVDAFDYFTYDIAPIPGGYALRYRSFEPASRRGVAFPGIFGLTIPTYDRTNGLSLGFAPQYLAPGAPLVVSPSVTYRSQLGRVDPAVAVEYHLDRRTSLLGTFGRDTRSNDRWIHSDFVNSALFFYDGDDARNYYRATGARAVIQQKWESETEVLSPYAGVVYERASGVRPGPFAAGGPWTMLARSDSERDDRLRPNPSISDGAISSLLLGADWHWSDAGITANARLDGEAGALRRTGTTGSHAFAQLTFDGGITFPTFGTQYLQLDGHAISSRGRTPRQRFAYLGGTGSIPTLELLSLGGDQLVFLEGAYQVPIDRLQLPLVGPPIVGLREILGGVAEGNFPSVHQAVGVRVTLKAIYAELLFDPAARQSHAGFGLSLSR
jgi:hypothetical protein